MSDTLLISATDVRKYTPVKGALDADYIDPTIKATQDIQLEEMLGYNLKEKLIELKGAGTLLTTSPYNNLFTGFVKPYLIWETVKQLAFSIYVDLNNQGVVQRTSDQGSGLTLGDYEVIKRNLGSVSDGYKKKLYDHLCMNSSLYPEYVSNQDGRQNPTGNGRPWGIYNW